MHPRIHAAANNLLAAFDLAQPAPPAPKANQGIIPAQFLR
jgi:hypothetical protein